MGREFLRGRLSGIGAGVACLEVPGSFLEVEVQFSSSAAFSSACSLA